jgi:LPXTG-motif cell wall-anchored protein
MQWINDNFWLVMGIGIVLILALLGLLFFLRNQNKD